VTHEEIASAIERLRRLPEKSAYKSTEIVNAIADCPWSYDFIDLLEQADPETHVALPVDADGEVIHIGDKVESDTSEDGTVFGIEYFEGGCVRIAVRPHNWDVPTWHDPEKYHRYRKPTIEDVLVDYHKECQLHASELGFVTDEDRERAWRDIATTFAERLREMMADE
jgi:uncharacterized protein YuzE